MTLEREPLFSHFIVRDELKVLTSCATTQPQAAFAAHTHGLAGKWSYLSRACSMTEEQFHTLEAGIRREFIPVFSGRAASDVERDLLGLPAARMGGLGLLNPVVEAETAPQLARSRSLWWTAC